jgi:hypothetical protein
MPRGRLPLLFGRAVSEVMVQHALVRDVVDYPRYAWRAWIVRKSSQALIVSEDREMDPERMTWRYAPGQEVPINSAPVVPIGRLLSHGRRRMGEGEVIRLDQTRPRFHIPVRAHGEADGIHLGQRGQPARPLVAREMRIPASVQEAESRRIQRSVYPVPVLDSAIALGHRTGIGSQTG